MLDQHGILRDKCKVGVKSRWTAPPREPLRRETVLQIGASPNIRRKLDREVPDDRSVPARDPKVLCFVHRPGACGCPAALTPERRQL